MAPVRIQLKRTKGWRMPENTVKVTRPGRWGNPYPVGTMPMYGDSGQTLEESLWAYRNLFVPGKDLSSLRGKNLACWCKLPAPGEPDNCHAQILLELANKD